MPLMCGSSKYTHTLLLESLLPADMSSMNFSILAVKTHDPVERQTISSEVSLLSFLKRENLPKPSLLFNRKGSENGSPGPPNREG